MISCLTTSGYTCGYFTLDAHVSKLKDWNLWVMNYHQIMAINRFDIFKTFIIYHISLHTRLSCSLSIESMVSKGDVCIKINILLWRWYDTLSSYATEMYVTLLVRFPHNGVWLVGCGWETTSVSLPDFLSLEGDPIPTWNIIHICNIIWKSHIYIYNNEY